MGRTGKQKRCYGVGGDLKVYFVLRDGRLAWAKLARLVMRPTPPARVTLLAATLDLKWSDSGEIKAAKRTLPSYFFFFFGFQSGGTVRKRKKKKKRGKLPLLSRRRWRRRKWSWKPDFCLRV